MADLFRVSKLLSERDICSRREADELIQKGWVTVDGSVAQIGDKATSKAIIIIHPGGLQWLNRKHTILLNKPVGYVSAQAEDGHTPAIKIIQKSSYFGDTCPLKSKEDFHGFAPAGRLDIDSKGLLILTQDGSLAKKVIQKDSAVSKEYIVKVNLSVTDEMVQRLSFGLALDGQPLKKATIQLLNPTLLNFTLNEGKKRQIRRMCEAVGLKVLSLKRIRIGNIQLGNLPEGQWRLLTKDEKKQLMSF